MSKKHSVAGSFEYALDGLKTALRNEPNFRVHLLVATIAIFVGYYVGLTPLEWLILVLVIAAVLVLELINTSLEALVDIVSPTRHPKAKIAKDVVSSAVLIAAFAAVVVGVLLFAPKLLALLA